MIFEVIVRTHDGLCAILETFLVKAPDAAAAAIKVMKTASKRYRDDAPYVAAVEHIKGTFVP